MSHVDIMTALFDQEEVTKALLASKEKQARDAERIEANADFIRKGRAAGIDIETLMQVTGLSRKEILAIK